MRFLFSWHRFSRSEASLFVAPALVLPLLYGGMLAKRSVQNRTPLPNAKDSPPLMKPPLGQDGPIVALAFAPDGKTLASSSGGIGIWEATGAVKLWSVQGLALKQLSQIPDRPFVGTGGGAFYHSYRTCVRSLAFSPDGAQLALGGNTPATLKSIGKGPRPATGWPMTGFVELHDVASGKLKWDWARSNIANSVAFAPDGKQVVVGAGKFGVGDVFMLDSTTGKPRWNALGQAEVQSVAFSPDGRRVATTANLGGRTRGNSGVQFWDAATGHLAKATPPAKPAPADNSDVPFVLAYAPQGRMVALNRWGNSVAKGGVMLLDAATGREMRRFDFAGMLVSDLAFSPDGKWLIAGGGPDESPGAQAGSVQVPVGKLMIWDAKTGALRQSLKFPDRVTALSFSPNGKLLATGTRGPTWGEIKLWDVKALTSAR